jgi:hypothetical protein
MAAVRVEQKAVFDQQCNLAPLAYRVAAWRFECAPHVDEPLATTRTRELLLTRLANELRRALFERDATIQACE